jgi:hypothetical protein
MTVNDPGYRTDVDWSVYTVCGYCHAVVRRDEYVRHDIETADGLARTRDDHALLCRLASERAGEPRCICRIDEYEAVAAVMAAERIVGG